MATSTALKNREARRDGDDRPIPTLPVMRFTVAQYELMIREKILREPERLELLDGWIVPKMTHNPRHDSAIYRLQVRLIRLLGEEWIVRVQSAITATGSLPEPDVVVVPGPEEKYDQERPTPREVELLVEVADTTLHQDAVVKLALYARDRVKQYWIINLVDNRIEVYTLPRAGRSPAYRRRKDYLPGDTIPVVIGRQTVGHLAVAELLP